MKTAPPYPAGDNPLPRDILTKWNFRPPGVFCQGNLLAILRHPLRIDSMALANNSAASTDKGYQIG